MVTQFIATGSGSDGAGGALVLILLAILFGAALYLIPSLCALIRKVPNTGSVIVINIFLGWTLVGYVVALAMALRSHPQPVAVYNQFGQGYPGQPATGHPAQP